MRNIQFAGFREMNPPTLDDMLIDESDETSDDEPEYERESGSDSENSDDK